VFVQITKSTRAKKTYLTYLVRESFRTAKGPRSRTVCNITNLPAAVPILALEGDRYGLVVGLDIAGAEGGWRWAA